jgi:hypothetical protein
MLVIARHEGESEREIPVPMYDEAPGFRPAPRGCYSPRYKEPSNARDDGSRCNVRRMTRRAVTARPCFGDEKRLDYVWGCHGRAVQVHPRLTQVDQGLTELGFRA